MHALGAPVKTFRSAPAKRGLVGAITIQARDYRIRYLID
jgi:hypothetical protein